MLVTCLCNRLHNVCDCKIVDQLHKCHLVEIHCNPLVLYQTLVLFYYWLGIQKLVVESLR